MLFRNVIACAVLIFLCVEANGGELRGLSLLPEECGFIQAERVVGSMYASLYEFPWMALIFHFAKDGGHVLRCSGTVINQWYVLTVAHCVNNTKSLQVRVGDYDRQQDVDCEGEGSTIVCEDQFQEIDVEESTVHEDYSLSIDRTQDIALLRLKTPIDFGHKNAAPVCLPATPDLQNNTLPGKEGIISGWELMINGKTTSKMLKVTVPIKESVDCNERISRDIGGANNRICTGGKDGVCPMESGSPLMLPRTKNDVFRYVQYGITSSGTTACDSDNWTVFTDVSKHMEWILNNLKA